MLIRWILTQEGKQKRPIIYTFLVSKRGKPVLPIWITSTADVIERLPRIPGSSHSFLISDVILLKASFPWAPEVFSYSVFSLKPTHGDMNFMEFCNQPFLLLWWIRNTGFPKITTSKNHGAQGKQSMCHPNRQVWKIKGYKRPSERSG